MTSGMIHVSQDLGTTNSNTVGTGKHSLGNMTTKLEAGRHVGQETGLMSQVDQFEGILKAQLKDLNINWYHLTGPENLQYTPKGRYRQHHRK
jgi:hypothetical protein